VPVAIVPNEIGELRPLNRYSCKPVAGDPSLSIAIKRPSGDHLTSYGFVPDVGAVPNEVGALLPLN